MLARAVMEPPPARFSGLEGVVMHRENCLGCGTAKFYAVRGIRSRGAGPAVGAGVRDTSVLV